MQDEVKISRILSQLEEIRREVKSMLPPPKPAPKAEPAAVPVQKPALPASDPAPTTMERFWSNVEDWFLVRGTFAPKGVTREFAIATRWLTRVGSVLLAASVGKLLLFDTSTLATPGRVGVFAAVGVLLIAGAFLYLKFKSRFEE